MFEDHFIVIRNVIREHQQKTFIMLSGFWPLRGKGCGGGAGVGGDFRENKKKNFRSFEVFLTILLRYFISKVLRMLTSYLYT